MKVLATITILFSLTAPRAVKPTPVQAPAPAARPHGIWYLAENGHAVYCYGPVKVIRDPLTGLQHVATFCKGEKAVVPLKD